MDDQQQVGYHKGALEALVNEKNELSRLLQIVNSLIEKHAKALQDAGVDVEEYLNQLAEEQKQRADQAKAQQGGQRQQGGQSRGGQQEGNQGGGRRDRQNRADRSSNDRQSRGGQQGGQQGGQHGGTGGGQRGGSQSQDEPDRAGLGGDQGRDGSQDEGGFGIDDDDSDEPWN
ncbi:MAG: hypothetical protein SV186_02775 [Candidatus Nanohaloarchaea archaeon]|nr:hypothetical protein [Candidatus Nanohaloarchaea archaeon]